MGRQRAASDNPTTISCREFNVNADVHVGVALFQSSIRRRDPRRGGGERDPGKMAGTRKFIRIPVSRGDTPTER